MRTAVCLAVVLFCSPAIAEEFKGKVVRVTDGDTIVVLDEGEVQHMVRLRGIDAPEEQQAFGARSKQALGELAHGRRVRVVWENRDRYQRLLGDVYAGGFHVNELMITDGFAWHYLDFDDRPKLADAEKGARLAKRGLWADANPIPPWEFRKARRSEKVVNLANQPDGVGVTSNAGVAGGIVAEESPATDEPPKEPAGFKVGDVVQLKSGGPKMTVASVSDGSAKCSWFDADDRIAHEVFDSKLLKAAKPDDDSDEDEREANDD